MCDAIMLARGIIGNPWLIKQVKDTFNFKRIKKTTIHQIKKYCIRHLWKLVRHYGVKKSIGMFRKFLPYYLKGKKDSKKILNQLNQINDYKKIIKYINHNFVN
jgi:tRNA-dihydrouridine synthase B